MTEGGCFGPCGLVGGKIVLVEIGQRQGCYAHGDDVSKCGIIYPHQGECTVPTLFRQAR